MKKILLFIPILYFFSCGEKEMNSTTTETVIEEMPMLNAPDSVLRHVVYFSFKETSSPEDIQGVVVRS